MRDHIEPPSPPVPPNPKLPKRVEVGGRRRGKPAFAGFGGGGQSLVVEVELSRVGEGNIAYEVVFYYSCIGSSWSTALMTLSFSSSHGGIGCCSGFWASIANEVVNL